MNSRYALRVARRLIIPFCAENAQKIVWERGFRFSKVTFRNRAARDPRPPLRGWSAGSRVCARLYTCVCGFQLKLVEHKWSVNGEVRLSRRARAHGNHDSTRKRERERLWIWITVNPLINPFFKAWKNWIDDKMDFKIDRIFLFSNYLFWHK